MYKRKKYYNKIKIKQLKAPKLFRPHIYNNCYVNPEHIHALRLLLNQFGTINNYNILTDSCYRLSSILGLSSDATHLLQQLFQEFLQGLSLFDEDSINENINKMNNAE